MARCQFIFYELVLPSFPTSRVCLELARRGEGPIAVLRASAERRDNVQRWLSARGIGSRGLVTITLRGYGDMPERNSNIEAWSAFARGFDPGVYFPVFIPNTEQTIEGLPSLMSGLPVFSEAVPRRQDAAQDDSQGIIACESAFAALENVEIDDKLTGLGPCVDADVLPVLRTLVDASLYCSTRALPPGEIE